MFEKIDSGAIEELNIEVIESFLCVYPKDEEIQSIKAAMKVFGIFDFGVALSQLQCDKAEEFMLSVLTQKSNLLKKAQILKKIIEMSPSINHILKCISNWTQFKNWIHESEVFIQIVNIAHKFYRVMKADTSSEEEGQGFELISLPRLFEVKSTI